MERRKFIHQSILAGMGCACLAPAGVPANGANHSAEPGVETPCDQKVEFTRNWTSRFFAILDKNLDEDTRNRIMRQNGEACYEGAYGKSGQTLPRSLEEIDKNLEDMHAFLGMDNPVRKGNVILFNYVGNPRGLKISDGYCLCPMLENGPAALSPTFCQCSVGYVGKMFHRITGRPVEVDLLESLRSGGKSCRFRITFES